jgi:hypothetical protein
MTRLKTRLDWSRTRVRLSMVRRLMRPVSPSVVAWSSLRSKACRVPSLAPTWAARVARWTTWAGRGRIPVGPGGEALAVRAGAELGQRPVQLRAEVDAGQLGQALPQLCGVAGDVLEDVLDRLAPLPLSRRAPARALPRRVPSRLAASW